MQNYDVCLFFFFCRALFNCFIINPCHVLFEPIRENHCFLTNQEQTKTDLESLLGFRAFSRAWHRLHPDWFIESRAFADCSNVLRLATSENLKNGISYITCSFSVFYVADLILFSVRNKKRIRQTMYRATPIKPTCKSNNDFRLAPSRSFL